MAAGQKPNISQINPESRTSICAMNKANLLKVLRAILSAGLASY
jgi:hypothetical protein